MITACPYCGAELGPRENPDGCLTCRGARLWSNPDRVVAVLESTEVPLAYWDVKRLLEGSGGRAVNAGSLQVWLSTDGRACWGGPGIYGLYRHGLLPGVRDLGRAAAVFIHALGFDVSQDEARHVLQRAGYRFQSTTIYLALRRVADAGLLVRDWGRWMPVGQPMGPLMGMWDQDEVETVMARAEDQALRALHELGTGVP